jgi:hypothetical protein
VCYYNAQTSVHACPGDTYKLGPGAQEWKNNNPQRAHPKRAHPIQAKAAREK